MLWTFISVDVVPLWVVPHCPLLGCITWGDMVRFVMLPL